MFTWSTAIFMFSTSHTVSAMVCIVSRPTSSRKLPWRLDGAPTFLKRPGLAAGFCFLPLTDCVSKNTPFRRRECVNVFASCSRESVSRCSASIKALLATARTTTQPSVA